MQKKTVIFVSVFFLVLLLSGCTVLQNAGNTILNIGNLSYLGLSSSSAVIALMRILLWILVFTIIFALITVAGAKEGKGLGFLKRNQATVVAAVMATITAIFLPAEVILATGTGWATLAALVLIGAPILGFAYLLWQIPGEGEPETKWTVLLKLVICLLLFWILSAMRYYVGGFPR